jgi:hypothetical protein
VVGLAVLSRENQVLGGVPFAVFEEHLNQRIPQGITLSSKSFTSNFGKSGFSFTSCVFS